MCPPRLSAHAVAETQTHARCRSGSRSPAPPSAVPVAVRRPAELHPALILIAVRRASPLSGLANAILRASQQRLSPSAAHEMQCVPCDDASKG